MHHQLPPAAPKRFSDTDFLCPLGSLCGRQVDEIDAPDEQQKDRDCEEAVQRRFVCPRGAGEDALVRIEVNIRQRLQKMLHIVLLVCVVSVFVPELGQLFLDARRDDSRHQPYKEL